MIISFLLNLSINLLSIQSNWLLKVEVLVYTHESIEASMIRFELDIKQYSVFWY